MARFLLIIFSIFVSCANEEPEQRAAEQAQENVPDTQELTATFSASLRINRNQIETLLRLQPNLFGLQSEIITAPVTEAFKALSFETVELDTRTRTLVLNFEENKSFVMSDKMTTLRVAPAVTFSNWRKTSSGFLLFDTTGLNYADNDVEMIRYSKSYGIEMQYGKDFMAFDVNPILDFYDRYENNFETFMTSLESHNERPLSKYISDAFQVFDWFSKTHKENVITITKDSLVSFLNQSSISINETLPLDSIESLTIKPKLISAEMSNGQDYVIDAQDHKLYVDQIISFHHKGPEELSVTGLKVRQKTVFINDRWHPIQHLRLQDQSVLITALVQPSKLFEPINISSTIAL